MAPDGPPGGGTADDVWERLRQLEDVDRGPVARPSPGPAPSAADPPAARGPSGATPRYFVPAPDASSAAAVSAPPREPIAPAAAEARYRDVRDAGRPPAAATPGSGPPPGARPTPAAKRSPRRRNPLRPKLKWFRPKLRWFFLYLPLLLVLLVALAAFWGWRTVNDLHRVDLGDSLAAANGEATNYLIVGSDSREGIDESTPNVGVIGTGTEVTGRRSDTIIVLRVEPDSARMMSIPRDLWVTNVATGSKGRINATYAQGPDNLVRSVTANLGIPVHRYVEVDFVSFAGMVDALGGIDIEFPHPAMDVASGLAIPTAGTHTLDGSQALAYVRSRHYVEEIDGTPVAQLDGDIGRQARQQTFIRTLLGSVGGTRNPVTLVRVAGAAAKGTRVDTEVGFFDLVSLARQLGGVDPETVVLPTQNARKGSAAVLELRNAEALPILASFGAGEQ